jgi:hypothetical protein
MRSELVFVAAARVDNRFLLCRMAGAAVRTMHHSTLPVHETINKVLTAIGSGAVRRALPGDYVVAPALPLVPASHAISPTSSSFAADVEKELALAGI